jgi:hypothetical protein
VAYATLTDVSTRLGRPITSTDEISQVLAWLDDIEALILTRIPTLDALVTAGTPTSAIVVMVEANAVIRKVRNPDGKVSEDIDDYSYRLNADAARGDLFLTDGEWALLAAGSSSGAFSVRPYFETDETASELLGWS